MPLPGTRVIHPEWADRHRPTATGSMLATCTITRPGSGGTTAADGTWTPAASTEIYAGACRVTFPPYSREQVALAGEAQVTQRRYGVYIEWDADEILIGDQVEITDAQDPLLPGRVFRVTDVGYGSEHWQRNLSCEEVEARE